MTGTLLIPVKDFERRIKRFFLELIKRLSSLLINEIKVNEDAEVKGKYISDILKLSESVKDDRKKLHIIRMKQIQ